MKNLAAPRLEFIDCLKAILILCVLSNHLPEYVGIDVSRSLWSELGGTGVSGFILLSGFGLTYSSLVKDVTYIPLTSFFWKRFSRIVPLYYAALFTFILLVDLIQPKNLLAHLFFVHTFYRYFSHHPGSFWFVGLVVQCYLIFPLAYQLLRQNKGSLLLIAGAIGLYSLGLVLQAQGFYIQDSVLFFSPEFFLGMILAVVVRQQGQVRSLKLGTLGLLLVELSSFLTLSHTGWLYELPDYLAFPIRTLSRICFFGLALHTVLLLEQKWPGFKQMAPVLSTMGFASYAVYLFHRPLVAVVTQGPGWNWLSDRFLASSNYLQLVGLAIIVLPILFPLGYWIQVIHDSLWKSQFWSTPTVQKALS